MDTYIYTDQIGINPTYILFRTDCPQELLKGNSLMVVETWGSTLRKVSFDRFKLKLRESGFRCDIVEFQGVV